MNKLILFLIYIIPIFRTNIYGVENMEKQFIDPEYLSIINQISAEIQEKITTRYQAEILPGSKEMVHWIDKPILKFEIVGPLTKNALRIILIDSSEELLSIINSNKKLNTFANKKSLTINDIRIGISIVDKNKQRVYHPNIFIASLRRGQLYFHTLDKDNEYEYKTTEMEEYDTQGVFIKFC